MRRAVDLFCLLLLACSATRDPSPSSDGGRDSSTTSTSDAGVTFAPDDTCSPEGGTCECACAPTREATSKLGCPPPSDDGCLQICCLPK